MKTNLKVGITIVFIMCSSFMMYSYDVADEGIKLISEDDMIDLLQSSKLNEDYTEEIIKRDKLYVGDKYKW